MENMCESNYMEVVDFVKDNIDRSLFIYSNMKMEDSIVRFKMYNGNIIGMYVIVFDKYITFLFNENIKEDYIVEIIEDSLSYKYTEGTVVNVSFDILNRYYNIKNSDDKTYIATLMLDINNEYIGCEDVELLNVGNTSEVKAYLEAIDKIEEFEPTSFDILNKNKLNSKIYVYKKGDKVIGGATLSSISDLTGVVVGVFVLEEYRCQKIATKLMNNLLFDNSNIIRNISIFFNNPYARDLYLKLGFKIKNQMSVFLKK